MGAGSSTAYVTFLYAENKRFIKDRVSKKSKPLHISLIEAAAIGDSQKISHLLAAKVDANLQDRCGRSALHLACAEDHLAVAQLLIQRGAIVNIADRWGREPLQEAMLNGKESLVKMLRDAGAFLSPQSQAEIETKFFQSAKSGDLATLKKLISTGVEIDTKDYLGRTALHIAAQHRHLNICEHLMSMGAQVSEFGPNGQNAIRSHEPSNQLNNTKDLSCEYVKNNMCTAPAKPRQRLARRASFTIMEACPKPIAEAMMEGREIEPIVKPMASLFISDIVGFTGISSNMEPQKLSRMLNMLFKKFDRLAHKHKVQKIDVIGDAYIAATNFTEDQTIDHAARLANFALDAIAAARSTPIDEDNPVQSGFLQIRVGLHSGPLSGSVIGTGNLKYTLMGDTVNVASKMESQGLPGHVQCSETTASLITRQAHHIILKPRKDGIANPHGTGRIQTYWVTNIRSGWHSHQSCPDIFSAYRRESAFQWRFLRNFRERLSAVDAIKLGGESGILTSGLSFKAPPLDQVNRKASSMNVRRLSSCREISQAKVQIDSLATDCETEAIEPITETMPFHDTSKAEKLPTSSASVDISLTSAATTRNHSIEFTKKESTAYAFPDFSRLHEPSDCGSSAKSLESRTIFCDDIEPTFTSKAHGRKLKYRKGPACKVQVASRCNVGLGCTQLIALGSRVLRTVRMQKQHFF